MRVHTQVPALGSPTIRTLDARVTGALVIILGVVAGLVQVSSGFNHANQLLGVVVPLLVGGSLIAAASRVPSRVLTVATSLVTALVSATAVHNSTAGAGAGGTGGAAALVLIVLQMCAFRSRREAWLQIGWGLAVFGVALALQFGVGASAGSWVTEAVVLAVLTGSGTWTRRRFDELLSELHHQADHDPLTGLLNRDGLHRATAHGLRIREYRTTHVEVTVLILDIDHFKKINDTWGHPAGDEVLMWLGGVLRASTNPPESAARFGGEEFLLVLPGNDLAVAYDRAERLRQLIASASSSLRHPVTVSIGVACGIVATRGGELTELYVRADEALYRAKEAGRNRVEVASDAAPVVLDPDPTPDRRTRQR